MRWLTVSLSIWNECVNVCVECSSCISIRTYYAVASFNSNVKNTIKSENELLWQWLWRISFNSKFLIYTNAKNVLYKWLHEIILPANEPVVFDTININHFAGLSCNNFLQGLWLIKCTEITLTRELEFADLNDTFVLSKWPWGRGRGGTLTKMAHKK